jgi:hypothetical protein
MLLIAAGTFGFADGDNKNNQPASLPASAGRVVFFRIVENTPADKARSEIVSSHLHFCVFENGTHDIIYVGTKFGGWYNGEFDLSFHDKVIFTGKVEDLIYGGQAFDMGNVLTTVERGNSQG